MNQDLAKRQTEKQSRRRIPPIPHHPQRKFHKFRLGHLRILPAIAPGSLIGTYTKAMLTLYGVLQSRQVFQLLNEKRLIAIP